jgi:hypothetical protein
MHDTYHESDEDGVSCVREVSSRGNVYHTYEHEQSEQVLYVINQIKSNQIKLCQFESHCKNEATERQKRTESNREGFLKRNGNP